MISSIEATLIQIESNRIEIYLKVNQIKCHDLMFAALKCTNKMCSWLIEFLIQYTHNTIQYNRGELNYRLDS